MHFKNNIMLLPRSQISTANTTNTIRKPLNKLNKKKSTSIPIHIKSIISCAIFLLSAQAILISTVYFHLNDNVETTVLNALSNTNLEKVEETILNALHLSTIQKPPKLKTMNETTKRLMYRQLYLSGQKGEIDLITMVKLATEADDIEEVVNVTDLPTQEEIKKMYGNEVVVEGLETCQAFRDTKTFQQRVIAPAGMFNTGTHLLWQLMKKNCKFSRPGQVNFQVPWGKHNPPAWKHRTIARQGGTGVIQDDVLPVVIIKDPINWIHSMCKHPYTTRWRHTVEHCPNLVPNNNDRGRYVDGVVHAEVKYNSTHSIPHWTLLHIWINNYLDWLKVKEYPRIFVRYEDLLFQPLVVIQKVCDCAGGKYVGDRAFYFEDENAKGEHGPHKGGSGMVHALQKYGSMEFRKNVVKEKGDYDYAKRTLNEEGFELMSRFHYSLPSMN